MPLYVQTPLSTMPPIVEANAPETGVGGMAARNDHRHERLTSTATGTLNGSAEATITFTRSFATKPSVVICYVESADNQPIICKVKSWTMSGSDYVGCVIKGYRLQQLPAVLTLLTQLLNFNVAGGTAVGAEYSFIAVASSA